MQEGSITLCFLYIWQFFFFFLVWCLQWRNLKWPHNTVILLLLNLFDLLPMDQTNWEDRVCILQCAKQQTSFATSVEGRNWNRWGWGWMHKSFACLKEISQSAELRIMAKIRRVYELISPWHNICLNMWAVCISVFCSKTWRRWWLWGYDAENTSICVCFFYILTFHDL